MKEVHRIHFVEDTEKKPTLRCLLFGHKDEVYVDAEGDEYDVCLRCYRIADAHWEDVGWVECKSQ